MKNSECQFPAGNRNDCCVEGQSGTKVTPSDESSDPRVWIKELAEAGWKQTRSTVWQAPCGCYFRGPWRAWQEMKGTHLADHIAAGL